MEDEFIYIQPKGIHDFEKIETKFNNKNNSTRSTNHNILYNTNLKHSRQKSTTNLNEFVIRKLSFNDAVQANICCDKLKSFCKYIFKYAFGVDKK